MVPATIDWNAVTDDELHESYWERIVALKEMFPLSFREKVHTTVDWTLWMTKKTFSFTRSALWIGSTTATIMILPVIIEKELAEMAKSQIMQQQQMLLGTTGK